MVLHTQAEDKAKMSAELQKLASKAVNRAHIKRTAGMELAAAKGCVAGCAHLLDTTRLLFLSMDGMHHACARGVLYADMCAASRFCYWCSFDGLEELEAHIKTCPAEEKAALLAELNEMATKALERAAPRSGKALWSRAKVMIPVCILSASPCPRLS